MNPNRLGLLIASAVLGVILLNQSIVRNIFKETILGRMILSFQDFSGENVKF